MNVIHAKNSENLVMGKKVKRFLAWHSRRNRRTVIGKKKKCSKIDCRNCRNKCNEYFKKGEDESMEQIVVSLDENSKSIQTELNNTKLSFVRIGYYLKQARDTFDWENTEYSDIWDYAQKCFVFSKSSASRFMSINDEFSIDGNSTELLPEYTQYSSSVLTEMLGLTKEERKEIKPDTTVKAVRKLKQEKHPETVKKKANDQVAGQLTLDSDFKEYVSEAKRDIAESMVEFNKINSVPTSQQIEIIETEKPIDTSIYDGKISLCPFCGGEMEPATMCLEKEKQDGSNVNYIKVRCYHCGSSGGRGWRHEEAIKKWNRRAEAEEKKVDEPELIEIPKLTNNQQRTEFIDNYLTWQLWLDYTEVGERYYRFTFDNGSALVVKVRQMHKMPYKEDDNGLEYRAETYYLQGIRIKFDGKKNVFAADRTRTFAECTTSKAVLVEFLKEYQKGAIE